MLLQIVTVQSILMTMEKFYKFVFLNLVSKITRAVICFVSLLSALLEKEKKQSSKVTFTLLKINKLA